MGHESQLSGYAHTGAINRITASMMNLPQLQPAGPRGRALGCEPTVLSGMNCDGPGLKGPSCNSFTQCLLGPDLNILHTSSDGSQEGVSTSMNVMIKSA